MTIINLAGEREMGSCLQNPRQLQQRRWEQPHPQPRPQNVPPLNNPYIIREQPQKKTKKEQSSSSELEENYSLQENSKQQKKYQSPELRINQMALFQKYQGMCSQNFANTVYLKVPTNHEQTCFQDIPQPLWIFPPQIGMMSSQTIKSGYFQQKMTWLRFQVQKLRVNWEHGCEMIQVDRHNILMSSVQQLEKINLRKQLKIKFDNEEVDDAGGVLREWMNLAVKEIFNFQMSGLLKICSTNETSYRFVLDPDQSEDQKHIRLIFARLLGIIIGKALFERISLNCFLTKSIWRQICNKPVRQGDFFFYDKEIYKNLKFIKENPIGTDLGLNFSYLISSDIKEATNVPLKPNGENIPVNDTNKQEFINLLINYFCTKTCKHYIDVVKEGINQVMPVAFLEVFQPFEMEMLLNGPQIINVQEWRNSTVYKKCSAKDKQVQWFWNYVTALDQQRLGNLLHYVTGSRRVPILGFFYLESNRNQLNRFTIQKVNYEKDNPYPKSHTCFNRLQLPNYSTQNELKQRMNVILFQQINSFGLS